MLTGRGVEMAPTAVAAPATRPLNADGIIGGVQAPMPALFRCVLRYCAAAVLATATASQSLAADPLASVERQAMMRFVADSWRDAQRADGFLPYGYDFLADRATDDPASAEYIVRQAGAFHAWAKYYALTRDERYRESLRRGIDALARRSIPIGKSRTQKWLEATRILSVPVGRLTLRAALARSGLLYRRTGPGKLVSADGQYSGAWAGATALALLAELAYSRASGDNRYADLRSAWLEGLLALRIPGGGFRELPTSIDDDADYLNGEAWLALAVYADLHPNEENVARALAEIDRSLMQRYVERPNVWFYSWGAMAAAQRWRTTADTRFVGFLKEQAKVFADRFEREFDPDGNHCDAMEGLAATLGVLVRSGDDRNELARRMRALLSRRTAALPRMQIRREQNRMELGGEAYLASPRLADFAGAFLLGRYEPVTRVDAAQHCLSALMMIDRDGLDHEPGTPMPVRR